MVPDDLWGRIEPPLLPVRPITDADGTQGAITARVQSAAVTPSAFAARLSEHDDLKVEHAKLD
ncbi:hypothetical protein ACN6K9_002782 [Streptomyces sp. SAS_267]|uniref:hypothetical protein n=1 Tax=Streptomyces sp. SAS_267 TaxID=3412750 RepID=UPI00403CA6B9